MFNSSFNIIPSWLVQPMLLQNVFSNPFTTLKDVPSCTLLPDTALFTAGLRQAMYWKRKLAPSTSKFTVIFSLLGSQGLIIPNVSEIIQALSNVFTTFNISEIYKTSNCHFIGFTFSSAQDASTFRSSFSYFDDCIVLHVPSSSQYTHHFKLLWLPPVFPDSRIHHFLAKHSIHHTFTRDHISTGNNSFSYTNSISGTLELSPDHDVSSLPHLIPLPSPHIGNAMLIISGRPSFCLKCGQVGHIRRTCPAPRCSTCHNYHLPANICSTHDSSLDLISSDLHSFSDSEVTPASVSSISLVSSSITTSDTSFSTPRSPLKQDLSKPPDNTENLPFASTLISTSSSTIINTNPLCSSSSNIYSHLQDEVIDTVSSSFTESHLDSTILLPNSSLAPVTLSTSLSLEQDTTLSDIPVILSSGSSTPLSHSPSAKKIRSSTPSAPDISASFPSKKRAKLSSNLASSSLLPPDSALSCPSTSWADQADMELDTQSQSSSSLLVASASSLMSASLLDPGSVLSASFHDTTSMPAVLDSVAPATSAEDHPSAPLPQSSAFDSSANLAFTPIDTSLAASDLLISSELHLDLITLSKLKAVCPQQEFSSDTLNKLKYLHENNISLEELIFRPDLLQRSYPSIVRLHQSLARHHMSALHIWDF